MIKQMTINFNDNDIYINEEERDSVIENTIRQVRHLLTKIQFPETYTINIKGGSKQDV